MMSHRILVMADMHIGSIKDIVYYYNTTIDIIDRECVYEKCDAIVIAGDYFHRLFKANEEYISLAINIMSYMVRLAKQRGIKIRLIYGTESHEMSQYRLFNHHISDKEVDFKIIETVTREELFLNVNVLYVPEEFMESKLDHYCAFFGYRYDYIFGHGVIQEGMKMLEYDSRPKSNEKKVPHFRTEELSSISNICIFGHYHCHTNLGEGVYYLGSLFRDSFGEEDPKGYGIIEDGKFMFRENEFAYIYDTITFDEDSVVYKDNHSLVQTIKEIKVQYNEIFTGDRRSGRVRLIFKVPENIDPAFRDTLRTLLFNDKNISHLIKETSDILKEVEEEISEEYDFILDGSLAITDKIHRFIRQEYEYDIPLVSLERYITDTFKI